MVIYFANFGTFARKFACWVFVLAFGHGSLISMTKTSYTDIYKGKIKSVSVTKNTIKFSAQNEPLRILVSKELKSYNKDGLIEERKIFDAGDALTVQCLFRYDILMRLISETCKNESGIKMNWSETTYEANGDEVTHNYVKEIGLESFTRKIFKNGLIDQKVSASTRNKKVFETVYGYKDKKLSYLEEYVKNMITGQRRIIYRNDYSADGNLEKVATFSPNGLPTMYTMYEYENKLLRRILKKNEKQQIEETIIYKYDAQLRPLENVVKDLNNKVILRKVFEYGTLNNATREFTFDQNGNESEHEEYRLDDKGNEVEIKIFKDKKPVELILQKFSYYE